MEGQNLKTTNLASNVLKRYKIYFKRQKQSIKKKVQRQTGVKSETSRLAALRRVAGLLLLLGEKRAEAAATLHLWLKESGGPNTGDDSELTDGLSGRRYLPACLAAI